MITGLGVDIVEIDRMKTALERTPRMKERVFTADERWYCEHRSKPEVHYAMRFAAKEAVLKALGTGFSGMRFTDVEVVREGNGRPVPKLTGRAAEVAAEKGIIEMHLSLSFTHSTAVASAVAITEEARPKKEERPDPKAELAQSFKEARAMLDQIGVEADESDAPIAVSDDQMTMDADLAEDLPEAAEPDDTEPDDTEPDDTEPDEAEPDEAEPEHRAPGEAPHEA